jgi:hypothetical protein
MRCPSRCFLHQEEFTFGEHLRKPTVRNPGSNSETRGRFCDGWAAISWYSTLLVPLLPYMTELLQGSKWTSWVIGCISRSERYFRKTMQFSKTTMPPFTYLELFSHGFKSMKLDFNIFPSQPNRHIWTSLNHSCQIWRLEWGTDSHLQHL